MLSALEPSSCAAAVSLLVFISVVTIIGTNLALCFICFNNSAHKRMADDVRARKGKCGLPSTPSRTGRCLGEAGVIGRGGRSTCVGSSGDDHFTALAKARQKHLQFASAVRNLGFVQDYDGVAQRAAAHEGERRDFK